jgi:Lrp/AsnC family leucine-responsive transcriptional regulator
MQAIELDHYDWRLLKALQKNARLSNVALSETVSLSPSQCSRRLQRLEQSGLIENYITHLNPSTLGFNVMAFVNVTLDKKGGKTAIAFQEEVKKIENILECYSVTGDTDYLLRVVSADLKSFSDFMMDKLVSLSGVSQVKSTVILDQIKHQTVLPLPS